MTGLSRVGWKWIVVLTLILVFATAWVVEDTMERLQPWVEARRILRDSPGVQAVPVPLSNTTIAKLTGNQIFFFGITLQTPWDGMGTASLESNDVTIPFPNHHVFLRVFEPSAEEFEQRMWKGILSDQGKKAKPTNLGLMSAEMNVLPSDLKWWRSQSQNEAASFLLESKAMALGDARGIYSIREGGLRGFQEGDPGVAPYTVRLDLYDARDLHYLIVISATSGNQPVVSQAEINAMVASIRQVPES